MKKLTFKSTLRTIAFTTVLTLGLASSGQAMAASQCKGLDNSACDSNAACGWVNAYERKDGRKVNGFCRTKSKGGAKKKVEQKAAQK